MLSRRLALVASLSVAGLLLGACGDAPGRTAAGLPKISLSASGGNTAAGASATADEKMSIMPYWNVDYVFDGTLPDLGAEATAYRFLAGGAPDLDRVRQIAEVLGAAGDVVEVPADQGGGWRIGAADYSGPVLSVAPDGMLSWWFSGDPAAGVAYGCAEPTSTDGKIGTLDSVAPDGAVRCDTPEPPAGVPDAAAAEQLASGLLEALGVETDGLEFETYADEWSAWVTAFRMIEGVRSPVAWSFGFGAEGAITSASGVLAEPEEVGDYPIVTTSAGLERLNDDTGRWGWFGGPVFARDAAVSSVAGMAGESVTAVASSDGSVTMDSGAAAVAPVPPDTAVLVDPAVTGTVLPSVVSAPDCLASDGCVPVDPTPMETQVITLTDVRLGLTSYWDAEGTVWLLPSYEFTNADGGMWSVIAVDEAYLDIPEVPMPEPLPVESVPAVDEPTDPAALPDPIETTVAESALVGLTEDEALRVVAEKGWILRVAVIDGVDQPLTMDYSPMRVNVAVADGVVTAVVSIG